MARKEARRPWSARSRPAGYPNAACLKDLGKLQALLVHFQSWLIAKGLKVILVFEGRDAAGDSGTIKAMTARVFRMVALPTPSERQKNQLYSQRHIEQFPAAGEVIILDHSRYNRIGVESVMGFVRDGQVEPLLSMTPMLEKAAVKEKGIILYRYWLDVYMAEQTRRLEHIPEVH